MRLSRIGRFLVCVTGLALGGVGAAWGGGTELSESELAAVNGQGVLAFSNSSYNGFDFSNVALAADVSFNANFKNISLGQYPYTPLNGTGADISIALLQFGRSDASEAQRLVQISNPYFEFVYNNAGGDGNRQIVGVRLGFDGIAGDLGLKASSISGSMLINGGANGQLDATGKRWDNSACAAPCLTLAQIGGVRAGDASGPSRDFWISMLSEPVQFQAPAGSGLPLPPIAQAGFWLNWRDRLSALNIDGVVPPNLAPGH
jgi:hypothetical protein